jgi:hypothetical protein
MMLPRPIYSDRRKIRYRGGEITGVGNTIMKHTNLSAILLAGAILAGLASAAPTDKSTELERAKLKIVELERRYTALRVKRIAEQNTALAVPAKLSLHSADRNRCLNHLKNLATAKEHWVVRSKASAGSPVTFDKLENVRSGVKAQECPAGGVYQLRKVGQRIHCSIHGPCPEKEKSKPTTDDLPWKPPADWEKL